MKRVLILLVFVACLAAGARWLSGARGRAAGRPHGTPDHWPAVARKQAA